MRIQRKPRCLIRRFEPRNRVQEPGVVSLEFLRLEEPMVSRPFQKKQQSERGGGLLIPGDPGASRREEPCRARRRGRRRSPTKETRPRASRRALGSPSSRARRGASARSFLVFPLNLISKP